jgi:23S rRNA pseudouridine1911/1915/1917 synthase
LFKQVLKMIDRQALHAAQIVFDHPVSRKNMTLTAPLPDDMQRVLAFLRDQHQPR